MSKAMTNPLVGDVIDDYEPTDDQLLCEPVPEAERIGTIIIPDSAKTPLTQGVVLKAGSACDETKYCKGRLIIFRLHTESRITIGGKPYLMVEPTNVFLTGPVLTEE